MKKEELADALSKHVKDNSLPVSPERQAQEVDSWWDMLSNAAKLRGVDVESINNFTIMSRETGDLPVCLVAGI